MRTTDISPLSVLLSRVDSAADGVKPRDTIASGFPSLDKILGGGLRRGDLAVLGGDVGSGKSALALAIALRAAGMHQTLFLSGEMSPDRIHERALAIEGRAPIDDLRRGRLDDATRAGVGAAAVRLRESLPIVDRIPSEGVDAISAMLSDMPDVELVIIDSLQAMGARQTPIAEGLALAIQAMKGLALDRGVAILTTVQLAPADARTDRRPSLDDFGVLGAVKHHADVVLALYREEMYDSARDITGATELLVRKNRNGGVGYVDLYFYAQWLRFEDMLDPDQ
jgi:replicative DNA helicase